MRKPIFEHFDGSLRNTEETFKDFFTLPSSAKSILTQDEINYCSLFSKTGEYLDNLPLINLPHNARKSIAINVPISDCHNFARGLLHSYVTQHSKVDAKLYYGYIDVYERDIYVGMYCHSFITLLINGVRTLFDPLLIKYIGNEERTLICSHYGINLPYDYVVSMFPMNYSRHIRTEIISSTEKTDKLMNDILLRK